MVWCILTPTRELAQQVFASFEKYAQGTDIKGALAYGGASIGPQIKALKTAQVIVATPGRLLDHIIKGSVVLSSVDSLVFDEADRMLDMGFIVVKNPQRAFSIQEKGDFR